jgi:hypothetical protein
MVRDVSRGLSSHMDFKDFFGKENAGLKAIIFATASFFGICWYGPLSALKS